MRVIVQLMPVHRQSALSTCALLGKQFFIRKDNVFFDQGVVNLQKFSLAVVISCTAIGVREAIHKGAVLIARVDDGDARVRGVLLRPPADVVEQVFEKEGRVVLIAALAEKKRATLRIA